MSTSPSEYYAFDDYRLSISGDKITLYTGRRQVQLNQDEARVLLTLFENRPNLVPKATLLKVLGTEDEGFLRKVVHELRRVLGDPKEEERIIQTERRRGYLFVAVARPESYEVFSANIIKPGTQPEIDNESPQPEPVVETAPPESVETIITSEPDVVMPAAREREEETQGQADAEDPQAEAGRENILAETYATLEQPTAEGGTRAAGDDQAPPPEPPPATEAPPSVIDSDDRLNTFGKWVRGPGMLLTIAAFVCVLTVFAFSVWGYVDEWDWLNALVSGAQLVLLAAALAYPIDGAHSFKQTGRTLKEDIKNSAGYDEPDEWAEASGIAEQVWERYKNYWLLVLFTWFLLYFSLTLTGLPGLGLNCPIDGSRFCVNSMRSPANLADKLQDLSNPVSGYLRGKLPEPTRQKLSDYRGPQPPPVELERAIVNVFNQALGDEDLYDVAPDHFGKDLSQEVKDRLPKRYKLRDEELAHLNRALLLKAFPDSEQNESIRHISIALRIATTLLNNVSSLLIFLCFNILNKPTKIKAGTGKVRDAYLPPGVALVLLVTLAEALLVIYWGSLLGKYEVLKVGSYVSGFFGGVAMALYFGRLQSAYLGTPRWFIMLLFIYTLIQSLFFFLEERDEAAVLLMNFALLMKCLLFLYMIWLFKSGRLLFYLVRIRRVHKRVLDEFHIFRRVLDKES